MPCCPEGATTLFATAAGTIVAMDQEALPISLFIDDSDDTINNLKAIVTSIGYQAQSGYQMMHAVREFVYVYVFTERVGEIVINGLAFPASCGPLGPQDDVDDAACVYGATGMERVITWYECNRITSRSDPIIIIIGGAVAYETFLVGMKLDVANAETGIAQFTYRFNFVPLVFDNDALCFDVDESCLDFPCAGFDVGEKKLLGWNSEND